MKTMEEEAQQLQCFKIQDVMKMLNVSRDTIRKAIERGELEAWKVSRDWRIPLHAIKAWIVKYNTPDGIPAPKRGKAKAKKE